MAHVKKWEKKRSTSQGGASMVIGKGIAILKLDPSSNSYMLVRNNVDYLPKHNHGFRYNDRNRVNTVDNPKKSYIKGGPIKTQTT